MPRSVLQVLKVNLLGHRKRIIASLADRPYEEPPAKPPRFSQLRVSPRLCSWCWQWPGCCFCPGSASPPTLSFKELTWGLSGITVPFLMSSSGLWGTWGAVEGVF